MFSLAIAKRGERERERVKVDRRFKNKKRL